MLTRSHPCTDCKRCAIQTILISFYITILPTVLIQVQGSSHEITFCEEDWQFSDLQVDCGNSPMQRIK